MQVLDGYGNFGGVQLVPPALVGVVRGFLQSKGLDPNILDANGALDSGSLLSLGFETVEVQTALTPTVTINLRDPADPETQALLNQVRPVIVFRGPAGTYRLAPYGQETDGLLAQLGDAKNEIFLGLAAAAVGLFMVLRARR